jgi:hypothetical protein
MRVLFRRAIITGLTLTAFMLAVASVSNAQFSSFGTSHSRLRSLGHGASVRIARGQAGFLHVVTPLQLRRTAPALAAGSRGFGRIPFFTRWTAAKWAAMKAAARYNTFAPVDRQLHANLSAMWASGSPQPLERRTGMTDNGIICGFFGNGCQPPDMAVAASPDWVVQFVNTSLTIYNKYGVMVLGFPIDAPTFFGVPSPGSCSPTGIPFMSDPRAFYDPNDKRFFLAIGAENGVADTCPFSANFYVAVSQTSDPSGSWNVYHFNADPLGVGGFGDYTQLGFDAQAVYIGMNLFPVTPAGVKACPVGYCWAQTLLINKHEMESGASVSTPNLIYDYTVDGFPLDTVQPVETIANLSQQPSATPLISSANFFGPDGNGCFPEVCDQLYVFGVSSPLTTPVVSFRLVTAPGWTYPPNGDEPGCGGCMETIDSRITGQPIYSPYHGGTVSFGLGTGVRIGTLTWPGNEWGEVSVASSGGSLTSASLYQSGYIDAIGVTNSFADTMLTPSGSLFVVDDVMSPTMYPGWVYYVQRPSDALGTLRAPALVQAGLDSFLPQFGKPGSGDLRWGDFEASSYTGFSDNEVWLASQYGNTDYDWGTSIAKVK